LSINSNEIPDSGSNELPKSVVWQKSQIEVNVTSEWRAVRKIAQAEHSYIVARELWESRGWPFGLRMTVFIFRSRGPEVKEDDEGAEIVGCGDGNPSGIGREHGGLPVRVGQDIR
jgi:hypothetical protein